MSNKITSLLKYQISTIHKASIALKPGRFTLEIAFPRILERSVNVINLSLSQGYAHPDVLTPGFKQLFHAALPAFGRRRLFSEWPRFRQKLFNVKSKLRRLLSALSVESHEEVRSAKSYSVVDHWKNERTVENFPELDGSEHPEVCVNTIIQE